MVWCLRDKQENMLFTKIELNDNVFFASSVIKYINDWLDLKLQ